MTRGMGGQSPSNITHHLQGIDFPAKKQDLIKHAQGKNADREVVEALEDLPEEEFNSMADVMKAFGEERSGESRGARAGGED